MCVFAGLRRRLINEKIIVGMADQAGNDIRDIVRDASDERNGEVEC